jgi:hypothetical protein
MSICEVTLALTFAADTPAEIIGAFVEWRTGEDSPPLPTLQESLGQRETERLTQLFLGDVITHEMMESLPPLHRAVGWKSLMFWSDSYRPGTPSCILRWDPHVSGWTLTLRALPDMAIEEAVSLVAPLGEFAADGTPAAPWFAGYVDDEYSARPALIWSTGSTAFQFELPEAEGW